MNIQKTISVSIVSHGLRNFWYKSGPHTGGWKRYSLFLPFVAMFLSFGDVAEIDRFEGN